ncbi:HipA domain-containing protein [Caballeronia sordidicola]|jgi:serine/threonine-protein kinase HipA|uniref:Protein hipA n=1 Tax=Caballeronia sordidicola TaxID=196367 RepID=A0A226WYV0_CABSO|nr:HipA domain-containing protein [Caballeronia sordidicola]OXC76355.1 Protein hipA [Caballeronia sordidicola]
MAHVLKVSTQDGSVGLLGFESQQDIYSFTYDETWRAREAAFPLSPHIPLLDARPKVGAVHRFLANLLPEGRALEVASVMYQMSKDNTFGLVHVLGREPVGALSFMGMAQEAASGEDGAEPAETEYTAVEENDALPVRRVVPNEELSERIRRRDEIPFPVWDRKLRLSVAGFQDKLQVLVEGESLSLVDGGPISSTHILKPESLNPASAFMVANEHYCMTLAASIGLPTATVQIRRIPEPILLIERFDREVELDPADGVTALRVRRTHIIDGCQALDLPVNLKYERNFGNAQAVRDIREGASFEKLFALEPHLENPAHGRRVMLRWALFQLFIGNSDAHGKNLSFHVRPAGLSPAPFYDLVSVNAYGEAVEQDMALAYGDAFRLDDVTAFELAYFAQCTGTPRTLVARELTRMARAITRVAGTLAQSEVYVGEERGMVKRIHDFVTVQVGKLMQLAPEVPRIDQSLL